VPGAAGLSTFLKPGLTGRGSHRGQCWLIPYISLESLAISRVVISVESSRFHGSLPRRFLVAPDPPRSLAMPPKTLAPTPGSLSLALHFALLSAIAKGVSPASSVAFGEALDARRAVTLLPWPLRAAQWSGVLRHWSLVSTARADEPRGSLSHAVKRASQTFPPAPPRAA